jgi:hypothetical protein
MTHVDDSLRQRLEEQMQAPRPAALEVVRTYLSYHVHDSDWHILELDVRSMSKVNPAAIVDVIEAIEELLTSSPEPGTLFELVSFDGNRMLDQESDDAAAAWLADLASRLRAWLGACAPPAP